MLLPSLLKSGDQVYQKVIKQLYQKMLLLNLLITLIYDSVITLGGGVRVRGPGLTV